MARLSIVFMAVLLGTAGAERLADNGDAIAANTFAKDSTDTGAGAADTVVSRGSAQADVKPHAQVQDQVSTSMELTLATGNMGGGPPQPEFLGGGWVDKFGDFEVALGAMVLATAKGCGNWPAKYDRYKPTECVAEKTIKYEGKTLSLPQTVAEILGSSEDLLKSVHAVDPKGVLPEWAKGNLNKKLLQKVFEVELAKGKGFSGPEACLKQRLAFPYFGEGFMTLADKWATGTPHDFRVMYLTDLRGADFKDAKGEPRTFNPVKMCKATSTRDKLFMKHTNKDDNVDWASLALWDLYVVKAFYEYHHIAGKEWKSPGALVTMGDTKAAEVILGIAKHVFGTVDLLFVQEAGDLCTKPAEDFEEAEAHCVAKENTKTGKLTYDAVFFLRRTVGTIKPDLTKKARDYYASMLAEVGSAKVGEMETGLAPEALATILQPKNINKKLIDSSGVPGVELAVASLKKGTAPVLVLLMSAHPDSDGKYCAFQLFLARQVFLKMKGETISLEYLIVGMDTNVQTEEDHKEKGKKRENGYNFDGFQAMVEKELGFTGMWPTAPTVNKQRTFLQAQLNKAAKHDVVKKDTIFIYPKQPPEQTSTITVFNKLDGKQQGNDKGMPTEDLVEGENYPKDYWPMDHFVTKAAVTL